MKNNLSLILKERKIKQKDLARAIGVSQGTVSKFCNGSSECDLKTIVDMANYLDVSVDVIVGLSVKSKSISDEDAQKIKFYQNEINKIFKKYNL